MREVIKAARKRAGLTQQEVANQLHITREFYNQIENEAIEPDFSWAERYGRLAEIINEDNLTMVVCAKKCFIGQKYCYTLLNNVDLSPMAALAKMESKDRQFDQAWNQLRDLMLNKRTVSDFNAEELLAVEECFSVLLDMEHIIETTKQIATMMGFRVSRWVADHNQKMVRKKYVDPKKPELQIA